jgi:hypothetical protein
MMSPSWSFSRFTRCPFKAVPFIESRSAIHHVVPSCTTSACRRETFTSGSCTSQERERPRTTRAEVTSCRCPSIDSVTVSRSGGGGGASSSTGSAAAGGR